MDTVRPAARERLLDTAGELFYRDGIRAVGIDTIVDRSGVARMTLYRHFASKDDLIAAYLERADERYWRWFEAAVGPPDAPLHGRIRGLFAALGDVLAATGHRGCPFLNAAAEFPDVAHSAHRIAAGNKRELRERLRAVLQEAGVRAPDTLAGQLVVLMNGAYASGAALGTAEPAVEAAEAAVQLVEANLPKAESFR